MKILISAGPTREYIDPIRFISNRSTGRMGYLVADYARKAGHEVILVSGPVSIPAPGGVRLVRVETAEEMKKAILLNFPSSDVLVMSAAVGDWKPASPEREKVKRKAEWLLKLVPNPDILKEVAGLKKNGQRVIGFALETEELIRNASKKLLEKNLDLIIADTPAFFGEGGRSRVVFLYRDGRKEEFECMERENVACRIIEIIGGD